MIQGGDVFRRDSQDGSPFRYDVAGLWGSGNTITERRLRLLGEGTVYTMWDGHALEGPGRPGAVIERYPALVATIPLATHLERYADLPGDGCLVWSGDEELGVDCDAACADHALRCDERTEAECLVACEGWPRSISTCIEAAQSCDEMETCNEAVWAERFQ